LIKLWLVSAQTLCAQGFAAYDDELFLTRAEALLKGEWLGNPSCFTMMKGPGSPLWLALNHYSGMPLLISQALLYVLACGILTRALRPVIHAPWARAALYLALLYNPASWEVQAVTRLTRESIYPALTLLVLASTMGAVLRVCNGPKASAPWAAIAGITGAFFVMTREEGVWVLPSLVLILCWGAVSSRRPEARSWIITAACAALAYVLPISAVAYENWRHYGIFETCETTTDYFKSAYGSLTRVKPDHWKPFVPVPYQVRQKVSTVSPAYQEIGQPLETIIQKWTNNSCGPPGSCDDPSGGWFIWVFRSAVSSTGKYDSGMSEARKWYRQLAGEIDTACRSGQLDCFPPRASLAPPWRNEYVPDFLDSFLRGGQFLTLFEDVSPQPIVPSIRESDIQRFEYMTNEHLQPYRFVMTGLLGSRVGKVDAALTANNKLIDGKIRIEPMSHDTGPADKGFMYWRYSVETSNYQVKLVFKGQPLAIPVAADSYRGSAGDLSWELESYREVPDASSRRIPLAGFRIGVLGALTKVYSLLMPLLAVMALVFLIRHIVRDLRTKCVQALPLFTLAVLGAIVTRLLMLSYIDVSSFSAINTNYMSPAYVLYIAAVVIALIHQGETFLAKRLQI
jgi:hypothetical protein